MLHLLLVAGQLERSARAFGVVCLCVCLSVRTCISKTIAPIGLIFVHNKYYTRVSVPL